MFVEHIEGISQAESWGAWSDGDVIDIELVEPVSGIIELTLTGGAFGINIGTPIDVQVGMIAQTITFKTPPWEPTTAVARFNALEAANHIKLHIPNPTRPKNWGWITTDSYKTD